MPDINMMGMTAKPNPDNHEAAMARADLYKLANYSFKLFKMIQDGQELEGWVQAKITKAADYIASVFHFMEYEMKFSEYGEKLETADVYTEQVKQQFIQKLTEARVKLEKLRTKNKKDLEEDTAKDRKDQWDNMTKSAKKKEKEEKGTGKFDVKKTSTGTQYTRKSSTFDDGGKDKDMKKAEKKTAESTEQPVGLGTRKVTGKVIPAEKPPGITPQMKSKRPTKHAPSPTPQHVDDPIRETLKGGQKKLDVDKDGKLEKSDFSKLRAGKNVKEAEDRQMTRAAKGVMKYGKDGMQALAKAGKEGKSLDPIRKKYDKYNEAAKPDFLDMDNDGNKKEPMKKAVADKKKMPVGKR